MEKTNNLVRFANYWRGPLSGFVALLGLAWFSLISSQAAAPAAIDGWSSKTGFRAAETNTQKLIVTAANSSAGFSSGRSSKTWPGLITVPWGVDTDGGDGQRMRDAISIYDNWFRSNPKKKTLSQIKVDMTNAFATSKYNAPCKQKLVSHIASKYDGIAAAMPSGSTVAIPKTDSDVINFLQFRRQCLEFANNIALPRGGNPKGYNAQGVSDTAKFRPGMAVFDGTSHAMILIDVEWKNSQPVTLKVAEASYGNGWTNPIGEEPWARNVQASRQFAYSNQYKIVDFEAK